MDGSSVSLPKNRFLRSTVCYNINFTVNLRLDTPEKQVSGFRSFNSLVLDFLRVIYVIFLRVVSFREGNLE